MGFCANCGKQISASGGKFCPFCGTVLIGTTQLVNSAGQVDLLDNLKRCDIVVQKVYTLISKIQQLEEVKIPRNSVRLTPLAKGFISYFVCLNIVGILFRLLIYTDLFEKTPLLVPIAPYLLVVLPVFPLFFLIPYFKKRDSEKQIILDKEIYEKTTALKNQKEQIYSQIDLILASNEGKYAKAFIPNDYFYPEAVSKFIFYAQNGQADTMKEALREYDQYIHRCKLEYEMNRTANASERTARASEQSAVANVAAANSMRAVEQWSASTHFWTVYNALKK